MAKLRQIQLISTKWARHKIEYRTLPKSYIVPCGKRRAPHPVIYGINLEAAGEITKSKNFNLQKNKEKNIVKKGIFKSPKADM